MTVDIIGSTLSPNTTSLFNWKDQKWTSTSTFNHNSNKRKIFFNIQSSPIVTWILKIFLPLGWRHKSSNPMMFAWPWYQYIDLLVLPQFRTRDDTLKNEQLAFLPTSNFLKFFRIFWKNFQFFSRVIWNESLKFKKLDWFGRKVWRLKFSNKAFLKLQ